MERVNRRTNYDFIYQRYLGSPGKRRGSRGSQWTGLRNFCFRGNPFGAAVKEDGISLYGFSTAEELELFHRLISVTGVGPKGALGFLSQLKPQEIILAILSDDVKTLSKAPGVGRKTAQRVILELKDKFQTADAIAMEMEADDLMPTGSNGAKFEAMDALAELGYSRSEAAKAVNGVAAEGMTTEDILKAALKKMVTF